MKKYKLTTHAHKQIKVPLKKRKSHRKGSTTFRLKDKVKSFFERDDNSRITTGKKTDIDPIQSKEANKVLE